MVLIRVRNPAVGEKRLTSQKMSYCWRRIAELLSSNRARSSSSRPKPLTTATPWMLSARNCTIFSTRLRFSAYSGWILRENIAARTHRTGVVARHATVSPGLRLAM